MEELVKTYEKDPKVVIARCNIAQNRVPVEIYQVPTIKLYPAEKKRLPVQYFGSKDDVEQLKRFIYDEGAKGDTLARVASRRSTIRSTTEADAEAGNRGMLGGNNSEK